MILIIVPLYEFKLYTKSYTIHLYLLIHNFSELLFELGAA
jgi:hypothetical protein